MRVKAQGYLSVIVGSHPRYEDGDILAAINSRRVRHLAAEGICCQGPGGHVGRSQPLRKIWLENVCEYRFERIATDRVRRTNLFTGAVDELSDTPNAKGEHIDVEEFVARRLRSGKLPLFGRPGAEVWYGGRTIAPHSKLDIIWQEIEARTAHREADFDKPPFSDFRRRLVLEVDDFSDAEAAQLAQPLRDPNDRFVLLKRRANRVLWRALPDVVEADVLDKRKEVRIWHLRKHMRSQIVKQKPMPISG